MGRAAPEGLVPPDWGSDWCTGGEWRAARLLAQRPCGPPPAPTPPRASAPVTVRSHPCPPSVHRFHVTVAPGTKLESGPATLHLCNDVLVVARDIPPAVMGQWKLSDLRRYGAVPGGFIFEGGTRCGYCKYAATRSPASTWLHPETLGLAPPAPCAGSEGVLDTGRVRVRRHTARRLVLRPRPPGGVGAAPLQPGGPVTAQGPVPEVTECPDGVKNKTRGKNEGVHRACAGKHIVDRGPQGHAAPGGRGLGRRAAVLLCGCGPRALRVRCPGAARCWAGQRGPGGSCAPISIQPGTPPDGGWAAPASSRAHPPTGPPEDDRGAQQGWPTRTAGLRASTGLQDLGPAGCPP